MIKYTNNDIQIYPENCKRTLAPLEKKLSPELSKPAMRIPEPSVLLQWHGYKASCYDVLLLNNSVVRNIPSWVGLLVDIHCTNLIAIDEATKQPDLKETILSENFK